MRKWELFSRKAAPRNLAICCDGTWNRPDQKDRGRIVPSNVVKISLAVCVVTAEGTQHFVYYDKGVGTAGCWDRFKGGVFGVGLLENVKQAHAAIAKNFQVGDRLFLFGFSRGAYTVRSLAGPIGTCGIPDVNRVDVEEATVEGLRESCRIP